jgi:HAE1 family hydrophobic/amphiphilic exporter-1
LLKAASVRLRPILLTNLVTFAALLPAAIGTTVGSQIFKPFAITVIGGLLSHLVASLIIIPTLLFTFLRTSKE